MSSLDLPVSVVVAVRVLAGAVTADDSVAVDFTVVVLGGGVTVLTGINVDLAV